MISGMLTRFPIGNLVQCVYEEKLDKVSHFAKHSLHDPFWGAKNSTGQKDRPTGKDGWQ